MKTDPRIMQEFLEVFTKALESWLKDHSLALINIGMKHKPEGDDDDEDCFVIGGTVQHNITGELKAWQVFFGKRHKSTVPEDVYPTLEKVTTALVTAYWPDRAKKLKRLKGGK